MIYKSFTDLVGNTPLLEADNYVKETGCKAKIYAKLENFNPAGSVKDRVALEMIEDARSKGKLVEGSTIIEPTSGNTGIGLAAVASIMGYRTIIVMPDSMSKERRMLIQAYGAELVLTPGALGMLGAVKKAEELQKEIPNSFIPAQFDNPANPQAHFKSTGPEIWDDLEGNVDVFVAGVGTGGTVTGTGSYLKSRNPNVKIVAVEPADSPLLSEGKAGPHGLQGIGANFVPSVLDKDIIDEIVTVTTEDAYSAARLFATKEGILVGISSGAALFAATKLAKKDEYKNKNIVVLLPDTGERYLMTPMFE